MLIMFIACLYQTVYLIYYYVVINVLNLPSYSLFICRYIKTVVAALLLFISTGSKQGCEGSLKHTQSLLTQNKEARFELQKKLDAMEDEKNRVEQERDEVCTCVLYTSVMLYLIV